MPQRPGSRPAAGAYGKNLGRQRPQGQQMYAGGSPNFNERTGTYRNQPQRFGGGGGRMGVNPGGGGGGRMGFEPWLQQPGMGGRYGGINPGGGYRPGGEMPDIRTGIPGVRRGTIQLRNMFGQDQMQQILRQRMQRQMQQQAMMRMLAQRQGGMMGGGF